MSWTPPPRLEWVEAVNAGRIPPISEEAATPFDRDQLLAEARARLGVADSGAGDFGDDAFVEPLDVLVRALEDEARLSVVGRWMTRRFLLRLLEVRLQLVAYVRADPGVRDEDVSAPLFVTGAPRTGTTLVHGILAADRHHRAPEGWELLRPVPPPEAATADHDARIPLADRELRMMAVVTGNLDGIHEYGARMPKECLSAMSFEFRSEEFTARYHVPSYVAWLQRADMRPAYEMHRLVLQVLQRRSRDVRWVLKSPVHLHSLPDLFAVYPDARLVVTHRDPLTVLASATSLVATLRWAHSDHVDAGEIGRYHAHLYHGALDGLVDHAVALDATRVHHVHYADLAADPIAATAALYARFGLPFDAATEARLRDYAVAQPKGRHGGHLYDFAGTGLDAAAERDRFARYQSHFGVPSEPAPSRL